MPKEKPPRTLVVELPLPPLKQGRKKPVPRIVMEISEGGANLIRCPFPDIDVEIHDYDIPMDWEVPENVGQIEPGVEVSLRHDVFGRRYQCIKFKRRLRKK